MPRTIVFIHGNFVTRHSWEPWIARFEARGHPCVAVAYPHRDASVAELKARPDDPALGALTLEATVDHIAGVIRGLDERPIVIGHSFGGLLTQLMVDRDLPAAAVTIGSVPPQGVISLEWSFYRSTWPIVNPLIPASRPYYMTFPQFQYTFTNDLPLEEQRAAYDAEVVPESRRLGRGGLTRAARVDFSRKRCPLLMIAGELDHIMPAALNRRNFGRYAASPSVTEFREFPDRGHYTIIAGSKGWEEVADYAVDWATRHADPVPASPTA